MKSSDDDILDMDFANKMMRRKEFFEKKKRLSLVTHSLLPPNQKKSSKIWDEAHYCYNEHGLGIDSGRKRTTSPAGLCHSYKESGRATHRSDSPLVPRGLYVADRLKSEDRNTRIGSDGHVHTYDDSVTPVSDMSDDCWWKDIMRRKAEAEMKGYAQMLSASQHSNN